MSSRKLAGPSAFEKVRTTQKRILVGIVAPAMLVATIGSFVGFLDDVELTIAVMTAFFALVVCFIVDLRHGSPGW
jgi:hypothetical protein